jgi:hypothetical protein
MLVFFVGLGWCVLTLWLLRIKNVPAASASPMEGRDLVLYWIGWAALFIGAISLVSSLLIVWIRKSAPNAATVVCPKCGYDLRGINWPQELHCPECGWAETASGQE